MGDLTQNFSRWEFADPVTGQDDISMDLVERLQAARDIYGRPIIISSGVRSPGHNKQIGGDPYSSHLYGLAADIACDGSHHRFLLLQALMHAGFKRIGCDAEHLHVDVDMTKPQGVLFFE